MSVRVRMKNGTKNGIKAALLSVAFGAAPLPAEKPAPPLLPIETLFAEPLDAVARLSPDGRWLGYLAPSEGKANIWLRPLETPSKASAPQVVTRETERPIADFEWSADGRYLLYLQDRGGDENFHLHAVRVARRGKSPLANEPARDLTPFEGVQAEIVALPSKRPNLVVLTLNRRNPELADAYRVNLETGVLELAAENPGNFLGYVADARGRIRAAWAIDAQGRYEIHARTNERAPWRQVRTYELEDEIKPLRFARSGNRIYLHSNHGRDLTQLALLDLTTGKEVDVDSDPLERVDLELALFDGRRGKPFATRYFDDRPRWIAHDSRFEKALALAAKARQGAITIASWTSDLTRWVVQIDGANDPGGTYLLDTHRGTTTRLSESRPGLAGLPLAEAEPVRFSARDGLPLSGYVTKPLSGTGPWPLVLAVHGGPWDRDRWGFDPETQLWANRGYAVLQVNFRGSTGFGKRFARAAKKEFGRAMQNDLLDAVAWAIREQIADPQEIAILGGSYGGYAVLEALAATPEVFACGVDYAGPSDLVTLIEAFPPSWKPFLARRWYPFVGNPEVPEDREDLRRRSPLHRADAIVDPLLIFQGANDPRVTQAQSDSIVRALTARHVPVTYLLASNEGHSFGNRETALAVRRATEVFLGQCLGGRVQTSVAPEIEATVRALTKAPAP